MTTARGLHHTYRDYVLMERDSPIKHEFCDGEIYAMAGGTPEHAALCAALIQLIGRVLPKNCHVMTSDVKVRINPSDLSTYPDVTVVCGKLERDSIDEHAVTNPVLVVDVTSPSSEDYDRGEKLSHYKQLPSLKTIVIASHRTRQVTVVERGDSSWTERHYRSNETVRTQQPTLELEVDVLYQALDGM